MPVFKCETCDKEFLRETHYQNHLSRKTPCSRRVEVANHECPRCHKLFRHDSSLSRHRHVCKGPKVTMEMLQAQVTQLQAQVQQINAPAVNVTNIDNSVTNNTNINITLNNYGSETQDHLESLSYSDLKKVLKLTPDHESLLRMIAFIHLNDQVPENRTIKLDDKDSSVISVYKRGRWREQNADKVLYDMICRNRLRFVDLEEILSKNMAKNKFLELTQYLIKAEDMANSEDANVHTEYAFQDLMSLIREKMAS